MSVLNFEEYTHELTEHEFNVVLPLFIEALKLKVGKNKATTSTMIIKRLKERKGINITGPRVRKIMHHITVMGLVPNLVASNKGYYVATTKKELEDYEISLMQRADSIYAKAKAINFQVKQWQ